MRIAVVNRYHPADVLGGSEVQCRLLMRQWIKIGHQVEYLALDGRGNSGEEMDESGPLVRLAPALGFSSFSRLRERLRATRPDIAYLRSFGQLWALERSCRAEGVPCVYNTCNISDLQPIIPSELLAAPWEFPVRLRGAVLRWLNHSTLFRIPVVTLNQEHTTWINTLGGSARCIYNSMEDAHKAGLPSKEKWVVWVANIKERKRPEVFMRLARDLEGRGWRFLMVGSLQNRKDEYLRRIRVTEKTCPGFTWMGPMKVPEVDSLLATSSILVNTCRPEGFGNNFIQAWLAACPTVSLEFDADNIMVREGLGLCPGSYVGLRGAVEQLMGDEELRQAMGLRAREWALRKHNPQENATRFIAYFEDCLQTLG